VKTSTKTEPGYSPIPLDPLVGLAHTWICDAWVVLQAINESLVCLWFSRPRPGRWFHVARFVDGEREHGLVFPAQHFRGGKA
jgi:hypothetical protein